MATTGNKFPTAAVNVDRAGATAWTSPGNVTADDTTDATVVVPSDYLVTSGYDFSAVPDAATIQGVTVRVEASESGTGNSNYVPQLHSNTTPTLIGSAKTAVTVNGTTKVISTNGGTADLWGATLTPAIVKNAGFGVSIWSTDTTNTLAIDFVTIAIEYTVAYTLDAGPGSFGITGVSDSQLASRLLNGGSGSFSLSGVAATLQAGRFLLADDGSFVLTGADAELIYTPVTGYTLNLESGSFALSGQTATVLVTRVLGVDPASYGFTGQLASVLTTRLLTLASGSYGVSGDPAVLVAGRVMNAGAGAVDLSGAVAALQAGRLLVGAAGTFAIVGADAELVYSGAGYLLTLGTGSYALTGAQSALLLGRIFAADVGSVVLTGNAAEMLTARSLSASSGNVTLTGFPAALTYEGDLELFLNAATGIYALTGGPITGLRRVPMRFGDAPADSPLGAGPPYRFGDD